MLGNALHWVPAPAIVTWASEIAPWVKALTNKHNDLSLSSVVHVVDGKNQLSFLFSAL